MSKIAHNSDKSGSINRRKCLGIIASSLAGAALTGPASAIAASTAQNKVSWSGYVIGSNASITLYTEDGESAKKLITEMLLEIRRLESLFSLFQDNSLLNELNARGSIKNPPEDFYVLINEALLAAERSEGRFDPTIQPLFLAYKACVYQDKPQPWGETEDVVKAKSLIDWSAVKCTRDEIRFGRPGMGLTLNGIAQGYITDRATKILKDAGFNQTLINFGEYHALEPRAGVDGWRIQLGDGAGLKTRPVWSMKNAAVAASSTYEYVFDKNMKLNHMLDPKSGVSRTDWLEIYVQAKNAALADAASTALFATAPNDATRIAKRLEVDRALLIKADGSKLSL